MKFQFTGLLWIMIAGPIFSQDLYTTGTPFNLYFTPFALSAGDFNKDGFMDVVCSGQNDLDGSGIVSVLFGKGDGSFKNKIDLVSEKYAMDVHVADMDGDGFPDIVTANTAVQTVSIFQNQKGTAFKAKDPVKIKGEPAALGIGDFDKDGKPDIAVLIRATKQIDWYRGTSYKLSASKLLDETPSGLRVDDLSGSGFAHTLVWYDNATFLSLIAATETKNFKWDFAVSKIDMLTAPSATYLADADNDGFEDAFVMRRGAGEIAITLSEANGLLLDKRTSLKIPPGSRDFAVGDFNKDQKTDIALLDSANAQVIIYLNQSATPAPASTIAQGRLLVNYQSDPAKPNTADVVMLGSYKNVSMYLYYPDGKPARKYFDIDSDLSDGQFTIEWTGGDENDVELPAGVYFFYYKLGGLILTRELKK